MRLTVFIALALHINIGVAFTQLAAALAEPQQYHCGLKSRSFSLPQGYSPVCIQSWTLSGGRCDGADNVQRWSSIRIDGEKGDWRMTPWTQQRILIFGVRACKLSGGPHGNTYVGDNYTPDVTVSLGLEKTCEVWNVPAGTALAFPGLDDAPKDNSAYFDLHNTCTGGGETMWRVDIMYSPQPDR
jgi:hypothetical protein